MTGLLYGLAALGGVVLLVLFYLWWKIWRPIRKAIKTTKQALGVDALMDMADSPEMELSSEIPSELEQIWAIRNGEWSNPANIEARVAEFAALGFARLGCFSGYAGITPMELLLHPSGVVGMVGEDDEGEAVRSKLLGFLPTGAPIIVSDRPDSCPIAQLPGEVRVYRVAESAVVMCQSFGEALAAHGALVPLAAESVVQQLEDLQRRRAFYLAANPGVIDPWLQDKSVGADPKRFDFLQNTVQQSLAECTTECCREQFAQESGMSAIHWERMRERLVFVHDRCFASEFEFLLDDDENDEEDKDEKTLADFSLSDLLDQSAQPIDRRSFAQRNTALPPHARMRPIAQLRQPVEADVYLRP